METALAVGQTWQDRQGVRVTILKMELDDSWYGGIITVQRPTRRTRIQVNLFTQRYKPVQESA